MSYEFDEAVTLMMKMEEVVSVMMEIVIVRGGSVVRV